MSGTRRHVLPELFAADADRVGRFPREAKVLAALNHLQIAHGPMPLAEALPIAKQIAEARGETLYIGTQSTLATTTGRGERVRDI